MIAKPAMECGATGGMNIGSTILIKQLRSLRVPMTVNWMRVKLHNGVLNAIGSNSKLCNHSEGTVMRWWSELSPEIAISPAFEIS